MADLTATIFPIVCCGHGETFTVTNAELPQRLNNMFIQRILNKKKYGMCAELNCIVTSLYLITEHNEFNPEKL